MRIKVIGRILENNDVDKTNYTHEIYSMILINLGVERAKQLHTKAKFKRLFTFTNTYIKEDMVHFYVSGEDSLIKELINGMVNNQLIKIGGKVINITKIEDITYEIKEKEEYYLKSKFVINQMENNRVNLSKDKQYIEKRINEIIKSKYEAIYGVDIDEDIQVSILTMNKKTTTYKNHHINSYQSTLKVKGSSKLVNLLFNVGIGENTASGHGFVWEA